MEITKEKIEELKKANGEIYKAVIKYRDEEQKSHSIEFIHRRPNFEDYESVQNDVAKMGSAVANQNLITGMIVYPAPAEIADKLSTCPVAIDRWVSKNILPYFGGDIEEVSSSKL